MALVAYDYDSTSENEDEEETNSSVIINKTTAKTNSHFPNDEQIPNGELRLKNEEITRENGLFSSLPETKTVENVLEDQIEDFIPKPKPHVKQKERVKITIPSLSQFTDVDEDEPQVKKLKPSAKGSSLMSILPPVKGTITTPKSFVPNIVTVKNQCINPNTNDVNPKASNMLIPKAVKKRADERKTTLPQKIQRTEQKNTGSDIESDDDIDIPETFDDEMWEKVCGRPKQKKQIIKEPEEPPPQNVVDIAPEPEKPYEGLDNKAFKELIGKSKRPVGNIKLIDINEEEILPDKDLWMTKSLTDPEMAPKPQVENPVDPTRRKKHHITYLAQQAKANEQELQNAWSASRNNRMATRAKYGF